MFQTVVSRADFSGDRTRGVFDVSLELRTKRIQSRHISIEIRKIECSNDFSKTRMIFNFIPGLYLSGNDFFLFSLSLSLFLSFSVVKMGLKLVSGEFTFFASFFLFFFFFFFSGFREKNFYLNFFYFIGVWRMHRWSGIWKVEAETRGG